MGRTATKTEDPAQLPALRVEAEQSVIQVQQMEVELIKTGI